jgi:soluble cytochrome b562
VSRLASVTAAVVLALTLAGASACQHTVRVQTGTRVVDAQGRVISESVKTVTVPASEAGKYRVVTVAQESKLAGLYDEAQRAIAAGDLTTAKAKLTEVVTISNTYKKAKAQLDSINAGKKVTADTGSGGSTGGTGGTTKPPPSKEPTASPTGLARWTPDVLSGFSAGKMQLDPLSVSRQYTAQKGALAQLVIYAEQFRSSSEARKQLALQVKQRYPVSPDTVEINGRTVYFGTDGQSFVAAGFTDGAVMVAIEGLPASDKRSGLMEQLVSVVEQLP